MNKPGMNPLVSIGIFGCFTIGLSFAIQLYSVFKSDRDIYWTAETMRLPLEDSGRDVMFYISGKPLQEHLEKGGLWALDEKGAQYRLVSRDITVRLNNWSKAKSSMLVNAVISGVGFGVILALLVTGLVQTYAGRKSPDKSRE